MKPFLPSKATPIVFGFFVSGIMTFIVSGISTYSAIGLTGQMVDKWMNAWIASWIVAFPIILFVAPMARWLVGKLVKPGAAS